MSVLDTKDLMGIDPETLSDDERVLAIQRLFSLFYSINEEQLQALSSYKKLCLLRWALPLADDQATDKWQEEDYVKFDAQAPSFVRLGPEDNCGFRNITFASDDEAAASPETSSVDRTSPESASTADIDTAGDAVPEQKPERKSMFNPKEFDPSFEKEPDDMATKTAKPAKGKKSKPAAEAHIETEYRIETEIVSKPVSWFYISPYDTRQSRPKKWVEELAASLKRDKQLEPCLARPDGQHIAGWTRVLAAPLAGLQELEVRIIHCDDLTARRLVLIDNAKRKDLTLREKCQAYLNLQADYEADGRPQKELLDDLGIERSTLSNITRLKSITEEIWERFEGDRLSVDQLREIATHAMVAGFADAVVKSLEANAADVRPGKMVFNDAMSAGFEAAYRPMAKGQVDFKVTETIREQLEVTTVDHPRLGKIQVATNAKAWDKLQQEAKDKKNAKEKPAAAASIDTSGESGPKVDDDKEARREAKKRAAELREKLIKETWGRAYARAIGARFAKPRKADYPALVRVMLLIQSVLPPADLMDVTDIIADDDVFYPNVIEYVTAFFTVDTPALADYRDLKLAELQTIAEWLGAPALTHWMPLPELIRTLTDKELVALRDGLELEEGVLDNERDELEKRVLAEWQPGKLGDGWCPEIFQLPGAA